MQPPKKAMQLQTAAAVEGTPLVLVDLPDPEPAERQVRGRVHACGMCYTDVNAANGMLAVPKLPLTPGHAIVGTVDRLGPAVTETKQDPYYLSGAAHGRMNGGLLDADYELTTADFVAFNVHLNLHRPVGRRLRWAIYVLLVVQVLLLAVIYLPQLFSGTEVTLVGVLPILAVISFWLWFGPSVLKRWISGQVMQVFTEERAGVGPHHLTLAGEGITDRSSYGESKTPWGEVEQIAVTRDHVFLYAGGTAAHVVPRRAFADPAALKRFVATAREYMQATQESR